MPISTSKHDHAPPHAKASPRTCICTSHRSGLLPLDAQSDPRCVGAKAARLGELTRASFNVPMGFVIPTSYCTSFFTNDQLRRILNTPLNPASPNDLSRSADHIAQAILSAPLPADLASAVAQVLGRVSTPTLAIRSSAQNEDCAGASFAGLYDTYLNVDKTDLASVLHSIKACYASLYSPRALYYRRKKGIPSDNAMAVILQEMVAPDLKGVAFTSFPSSSHLTIETIYDVRSPLACGTQTREALVVDVTLPSLPPSSSLLNVSQLRALIHTVTRIEQHFQCPQDVEWVVSKDTLFIVQSRPQVALPQPLTGDAVYAVGSTPLIEGRVAKAPLFSIPPDPYVLVLEEGNPRYIPFLENAVAVIAEQGGLLDHFAIVCREVGIPFVVIKDAFQQFEDGSFVRLNIRRRSSSFSTTQCKERWIRLACFIPPLRDARYAAELARTLQDFPRILDQPFRLQVRVRPKGIAIHEDSLARIVSAVINDSCGTLFRIRRHLSQKYDVSVGILAPMLVEVLFKQLVILTSNPCLALTLLRGVDPLYLSFGEHYTCRGDEPYLLRLGFRAGDTLQVPAKLKRKALSRGQLSSTLCWVPKEEEASRIETVSELIRLLIMAYEGKNRLLA